MNRKKFLKSSVALTSAALFLPGVIMHKNKISTGNNFSSTNDLWRMSAVELGSLVRKKRASVKEVMEAHIERIKAVNPKINAVTSLFEENSLKEAVIKDQFLSKKTGS